MHRKKIILLLCALVAVGLFFYFDLPRFFTLAALKANRQLLLAYYGDHPGRTILGFMLLYIVQTILSLPGAAIMSLAAGAIFGPLFGTIYASLAATTGATLAFLVYRYLLRDFVLSRFGSRLAGINRELELRGLNYLLFLRLVPIFPFFIINMAASLTDLPLRTFVLGTIIGIIPAGFVFVNAGASLATIDAFADVASPRVLGSLALLGLSALLPALYNRYMRRKPGPPSQEEE